MVEENKSESKKELIVEKLYIKFNSELVNYTRHKLFCLKGINNYSDAEDIVQNTYLKLLKYMPPKINIQNEKAYLYAVLQNEISNYLKKSQPEDIFEVTDLLVNDISLDEILISKLSTERISLIINYLEYDLKTPMILRYGYDLSVEEISKQLGINTKTVYYRLQKAKKIVIDEYYRGENEKNNKKTLQ